MQPKSDTATESLGLRRRRSAGQIVVARALWYVRPGIAELRSERLGPPRPGEARVATLFSAISRGTERLVSNGEIPSSEWARMRAPLQAGTFPYPVKYGYCATGLVTAGSEQLIGKQVFCLHPHQDHFQVAEAMLTVIPETVPAKRATLAANMETALNAHWDAGTAPGDRVLVIGAGTVGLLTAYLAQRIAGVDVAISDVDPNRAQYAAALGLRFFEPHQAPKENRIVFHTSATGDGLQTAIDSAAFEGRVVELSWYGARAATVHLGGAFHSRRLQIVSSQVGHVASRQRATVTHRERLVRALALLDDARLDALTEDEIAFEDVPTNLARIMSGPSGAPTIRYSHP